MFGYVTANKGVMTQEDLVRYRACYCGLCGSLKKHYKEAGRITLTYDMTFLILLLSSLYEPESSEAYGRCAVHPIKPHLHWENRFTKYAADMNIALAYHNCMDDWRDDRNIIKRGEAALLKKDYKGIEKRYPRQCNAITRGLSILAEIEKEKRYDLDAAANCFGEMMAELFVFEEDRWSDALRRIAAALGRFVYTMDAYEDIGDDMKRGKYNPLKEMYKKAGFEKQCTEILQLFIGECAQEFEKLPLIQDVEIMRNILYSGVWTKYAMISAKKEKSGSSKKENSVREWSEERN